MGFFDKINAVWQKINLVQRALLIAIGLAIAIVGALLVQWARKPDMGLLYSDLMPEEASMITEKISENDVAYELHRGGTAVYVPREKIYQLRLDMAKEGLPAGEQSGYKIFDNEKIGVSPFVQNVNLKRAQEEELAKSIQMIDGVVYARIHIVSPERTLFSSETGQTSASVVLRLKPGYRISPRNIAAITHMVSGGVQRLNPENITVVDSEGHLLSSESGNTLAPGAETVQNYRQRVEQNLANKVEEMLTTVLGQGRATVRVSAVIDMNSVSTVTEKYDPAAKVATKEEITSGSETGAGGGAGANGQTAGSTKKEETVITEYQVGKTVEQKSVLPGNIRSLSVAAFVDLSAPDANEAAGGEQKAMIMQISEVEEIIRNALGLRETDSLKVVHAKFHQPIQLLSEEKPSSWPRYLAIVRNASLGIMAICALLVLRIFRKAHKKAAAASLLEKLPAGEAASLLPAGNVTPSETVAVRREIAGVLKRNPNQVKQLFASWIEQKE